MAQIVKLKRTSVSGKVPTTSNIELGELAMNTYDGRIFFEKNDGSATIQEILTTNAGRAITGSININGAITASYFKGDGSALTNVTANISEQATVTSSFDSESTIDVAHNFSSKNIIVSVYDSNDNQIIPQTVTLTNTDNVRVVLSAAQSGFVVVAKGGHVLSGSADNANQLNGQTAAYYLNYNNFNNVPSGIVSGSSQIDAQSTSNPSAIYDNSGTPTLRSGITAMEVRTAIGLDDTDSIQFNSLNIGSDIVIAPSTGNTLQVDSETDSTSTSTGAITTLGGVGIAKNLNVGGTLSAPSASFEKAFIGTGSNNVEINYNGNNGTDIIAKYALNNSQSHTITLNAPSINIGYDSVTNDYADNIRLYGLQAVTETNALVISDGQVVGTRELGSNAFNSTAYLENLNGTGVHSGSVQVVSSLLNQNVNLGSGKLTSTDIEFSGDISGSSTSTGSFGRVEVNANTLQIGNQEINQTLLSNVKNVFSSTTLQDGSVSLAGSLPSGVISGSSFSSPSQGTVRATINGSNTDVDTGLQTGDSPQFTNLTLTGNLTVQGTTTTIDSTTVNIGDNILELNYGGSATTSGILTKDATGGSTTSGSLLWNATNDYWTAGKLGSEEEILLRNTHGVISGSSQLTFGGHQLISSSSLNLSGSWQDDNAGTSIRWTDDNYIKYLGDSYGDLDIGTEDSLRIFSGVGAEATRIASFSSDWSELTGNLRLTGIPTKSSEATALVIDGSSYVGTRELGSNAFNSTAYLENLNGTDVISGSAQVVSSLVSQSVDFGTGNISNITSASIDNLTITKGNHTNGASITSGKINFGDNDVFISNPATNNKEIYTNSDYFTINTTYFSANSETYGDIFSFGDDGRAKVHYRNGVRIKTSDAGISFYGNGSSVTHLYYSDEGGDLLGKTVNGAWMGTISGSDQITNLTTHKETVSGASSYAVDHNLNEQYPIVQAWNTATSKQELPNSITTNSGNRVTVDFSTTFAGIIIVKK